jgi:TRAP-type C4-dicarboxylate transport system permease small subunit
MGYIYLALPIAGIFMVIYTIENLVETLTTSAAQLQEAESAEEVD